MWHPKFSFIRLMYAYEGYIYIYKGEFYGWNKKILDKPYLKLKYMLYRSSLYFDIIFLFI